MFIDTHSHIYSEEFDDDRSIVIERAVTAGVSRIILPDIDSDNREALLRCADQFPDICFPLSGLHPTSVKENYAAELQAIEKELATGKYYGIGECGLDFYWDTTFEKEQIEAFEYQLNLARECSLPVVIHSRNSLTEILEILRRHQDIKGILHCFPGDPDEAARACDMGFYLGIGGVVTFKKSHLPEVIQKVGLQHIVLETDAPYLAPVPFRGKRNESSYIPLIAEKIAEIVGTDLQTVQEITTSNALKIFNLNQL